ncbi:MAG: glycoside hydrolase family 97 protein [Bacteroidales bacterium]|nr:glycoside hydrolase family 97 protein [Bacteroidales bacterium]
MRTTFLAAALLAAVACSPKMTVSSPDGRIAVRFALDASGIPSYAVDVDGAALVEPSVMGLLSDEVNLDRGFSLVSSRTKSVRETWHQPWGENKEVEDSHRELTLHLENEAGVGLDVVFRVFDDGVGFRYRYAVPGADTIRIIGERTRFAFASDATSWSIPGDFNSYEHLYRKMPLSELRDTNTPLTLKFSDGLYAAVHEAALVDFPEMVLRHDIGLTFQSSLAPLRQQRRRRGAPLTEQLDVKAVVPGTFETPWRTVQIGRKAVDLVNSSLILNLNEPCALADVSWIRPMKYIGVWWSLHLGLESWGGEGHGATTENAMRYIDFAAANNIQGVLFEGWNDAWRGSDALPDFDFTRPAPDYDVEKVAAYARGKGIYLITHNETGGNYRRFEEQLERALDWDASLGIHAMKTGYAGGGLSGGAPRHSQTGVRHFQKVVEEAAGRQIMVDGHEVVKATGLRRTWPNFMTRECVRGMEYNGWGPGNPPSHTVTLPYTRLLGGPVDYTPGVFDILYTCTEGRPQLRTWGRPATECREHTTLAKQMANWVILYSPMQMACDLLENYEGHPAFQFFRDFDADCDASEALQGEVGEWIAVVRRAGDRFFLGAATDESARTVEQPLTFLRPGVRYTATIYGDAPETDLETNPAACEITSYTLTSDDTLTLRLAAGGGAAVSFIPE